MSGKKQHFIPQFVLRKFAADRESVTKIEHVWVYRKEQPPFCASTQGAGTQNYFYSRPSEAGIATLDDIITAHEDEMAEMHRDFLSTAQGVALDSVNCARFVGHLIIRNAHLRSALKHGFTSVMEAVENLFASETDFSHTLGLKGPRPSRRFLDKFYGAVGDEFDATELGLTIEQLASIAFWAAKENSPSVSDQISQSLGGGMRQFVSELDNRVSEGHREILTDMLAPPGMVNALAQLNWTVVECSDEIILPDCVAISRDESRDWHPLMLSDSGDIAQVVCAVAARRMLLGTVSPHPEIKLVDYNLAAAMCSNDFFISSAGPERFLELQEHLGRGAYQLIDAHIDLAAQEFREEGALERSKWPQLKPGYRVDEMKSGSIEVSLVGFGDEKLAKDVGIFITDIIAELSSTLTIGAIEGFTFASDYEAALASLDRGHAGLGPPKTVSQIRGLGLAMAPIVVRDERLHFRVVARESVARGLLSDDPQEHVISVRALVYSICVAAEAAIRDRDIPGILAGTFKDEIDSCRFPIMYDTWRSYFCSRITAGLQTFSLSEKIEDLQEYLLNLRERVESAHLAHVSEPDFAKLGAFGFEEARTFLSFMAEILGEIDRSNEPEVALDSLKSLLAEQGLENWLHRYRKDLSGMWMSQGQNSMFDDLCVSLDHVDRILFTMGLFVWQNDDGRLMIYPRELTLH